MLRRQWQFRRRQRDSQSSRHGAWNLYPSHLDPSLSTPHLFLLPGPPRELKPMFEQGVLPILQGIRGERPDQEYRNFNVVGLGESAVEESIGNGAESARRYRSRLLRAAQRSRPPPASSRRRAVLEEAGRGCPARSAGTWSSRMVSLSKRSSSAASPRWGRPSRLRNHAPAGCLPIASPTCRAHLEFFSKAWSPTRTKQKFAAWAFRRFLSRRMGRSASLLPGQWPAARRPGAARDYGIGITGIAGPDGGTPEKPTGTVFVAVSERDAATECLREFFPTDREPSSNWPASWPLIV